MEMTDEAEPTITSPKMQSSVTVMRSRVAVGICCTAAAIPDPGIGRPLAALALAFDVMSLPLCRRRSASCSSRELRHREEVAVEDAQTESDEQSAQDPKAHDHGGLGPPQQFEMVMDRRHPEDAAMEGPEAHDLGDDREGLHHEEATDDGQEEVQVQQEAQGGQPR